MKIRNIIASTLCAAALTMTGCSKDASSNNNATTYQKKAEIKYNLKFEGFELSKKVSENESYWASMNGEMLIVGIQLPKKGQLIFRSRYYGIISLEDISWIFNKKNGVICYGKDSIGPECDKKTLKQGEKWLNYALDKLEFKKFRKRYKNDLKKDVLEGWR